MVSAANLHQHLLFLPVRRRRERERGREGVMGDLLWISVVALAQSERRSGKEPREAVSISGMPTRLKEFLVG